MHPPKAGVRGFQCHVGADLPLHRKVPLARDSKLYALNKDTGKVITTKDLPNGSQGVPAVYEVNGREYVLIAVSGGNPFPAGGRLAPGGVHPPAISKSYIAFSLPDTRSR
jgi:quinoprotein glucose dehydrogenase